MRSTPSPRGPETNSPIAKQSFKLETLAPLELKHNKWSAVRDKVHDGIIDTNQEQHKQTRRLHSQPSFRDIAVAVTAKKDERTEDVKAQELHGPEIRMLQSRVDKYMFAADLMGARCSKLDMQIEAVRAKILQQKVKRKRMGGVKAETILHQKMIKENIMLETKLSDATARVSQAEICNVTLRRTINALRKEKILFNNVNALLANKFSEKQRAMADIIKEANLAHSIREDALMGLSGLAEKNEYEQERFEKESEELVVVVEEHFKREAYVKTSALKKKERELKEQIEVGGLDPEQESIMRTKLAKLKTKVNRKKRNISESENEIQSYEQAFARLKRTAGTDDINQIVETFVTNEDTNFGIFNYIQHLKDDTDQLDNKRILVEEEMKKFKNDEGQSESVRKRILFEMERKRETIHSKMASLVKRNDKRYHLLGSLLSAIESLFNTIGCPSMKALEGFRSPTIKSGSFKENKSFRRRSTIRSRSGSTSSNPFLRPQTAAHPRRGQISDDNGSKSNRPVSAQVLRSSSKRRPSRKMSSVSFVQEIDTTIDETIASKGPSLMSPTSLSVQLGSSVSEQNVMQYLGVIEHRMHDVMKGYLISRLMVTTMNEEEKSKLPVLLSQPPAPAFNPPLRIRPPSGQSLEFKQRSAKLVKSRSTMSLNSGEKKKEPIKDETPLSIQAIRASIKEELEQMEANSNSVFQHPQQPNSDQAASIAAMAQLASDPSVSVIGVGAPSRLPMKRQNSLISRGKLDPIDIAQPSNNRNTSML